MKTTRITDLRHKLRRSRFADSEQSDNGLIFGQLYRKLGHSATYLKAVFHEHCQLRGKVSDNEPDGIIEV